MKPATLNKLTSVSPKAGVEFKANATHVMEDGGYSSIIRITENNSNGTFFKDNWASDLNPMRVFVLALDMAIPATKVAYNLMSAEEAEPQGETLNSQMVPRHLVWNIDGMEVHIGARASSKGMTLTVEFRRPDVFSLTSDGIEKVMLHLYQAIINRMQTVTAA